LSFSRNEYQKQSKSFSVVERGRRVRLTNSPPYVNRLSRQCGIIHISQPFRPPRSVMGIALLFSCSSETSVYFQRITRRYIPEQSSYNCRCSDDVLHMYATTLVTQTEVDRCLPSIPPDKLWTSTWVRSCLLLSKPFINHSFYHSSLHCLQPITNSVALVRERTIPTERPPLVGEVSANFCG
jgi:hypothetical protein